MMDAIFITNTVILDTPVDNDAALVVFVLALDCCGHSALIERVPSPSVAAALSVRLSDCEGPAVAGCRPFAGARELLPFTWHVAERCHSVV
jgi:hypothetical protein